MDAPAPVTTTPATHPPDCVGPMDTCAHGKGPTATVLSWRCGWPPCREGGRSLGFRVYSCLITENPRPTEAEKPVW